AARKMGRDAARVCCSARWLIARRWRTAGIRAREHGALQGSHGVHCCRAIAEDGDGQDSEICFAKRSRGDCAAVTPHKLSCLPLLPATVRERNDTHNNQFVL